MSYARNWRHLLPRARSIPNKEENRGDDDREKEIAYPFSFQNSWVIVHLLLRPLSALSSREPPNSRKTLGRCRGFKSAKPAS
jgi:hypothetical protein